MAVSTVIMLAILSTVAASPSLGASIGKQNRIRLVDGFTENEGVVEIQHVEMIKNAKVGVAWGTICVPPGPSSNIGQVACRQLGYEAFGYFLSVGQFTSLNYRRVALKVTKCKGNELSLETCQSMLFPTQLDCSQQQFLAVMCAKNGTVRFESTSSSEQHSGQVEAFIGGTWKDVCPSRADSREHICSQLGYSAGMPGMPPPGRLRSSVSPDWDGSDERCQDNMYGTEGCVWYHKKQGLCGVTNYQIKCLGPPGKVAQPSVSAITGTSAIVNWESVAERNAPIANYTIIYWRRDGGRNNASNINMISVPASPSDGLLEAELTGLTSDTVYSIEIAGVSEAQGPGEFSEPLAFNMPKELTRPPTLTDLKARQLPGGAVDITYKIHNSRSSVKLVEAYFWTVAERETISNARFVSSPINHQDKITLRGLLPSTNYTARLRVLSEINGLELVGNFSLITFVADNTSFHPAPTLSAKRVNISLVELSWAHVSSSLFRWSCYSNIEHFKVEGLYSRQRNAILPHSDNTQSLTVIPEEQVHCITIPLVNLEFNCSVSAEDREGVRNSEWSSAVRVEPLITSPTRIATVDTRVEGSTAFINWKAPPSSAQLPRQWRQSAQPAVKPLALSVNCTFPDVNQVREYFWWSPIEGESLTMESLPLGANGSCSATLYTHEGPGQSYTFPIHTEAVPVGFHPAPTLSAKRVNISLVELSWTHVSSSLFRWSCYSNIEHFKVEGLYSGQRNAILPHSDNTQSSTMIPEEQVHCIAIPLVNLEFNCSVAAEDREGVRNSEWSSAVKVEPLITNPPSIATVDTRVEGSTAFINWKAPPSSAQLPRQRRQSAQPAVKPLALSVNCTFPGVNQVREYFWWSPIEGESLTMESLPLGANGSCSATLYTHEGPGQSYTFPIHTEAVPVVDLLSLRAPLVSGTNVTIEWVLPVDIIPRQTTIVVWSVYDVSAATNYVVRPHDARRMSFKLAQGEVYVCMVLVDVQGGGRLQSNPVQFRVPNAITTKLSSALGDAGNDGTTLTVHWSRIEDATGYVVMATSYIGKQRNETVTRVVFGPADGTGNQELRVSIPFNIECSDKFKFKVAAFNSFGMGLYTDEVEVRPQETCDSFSSPSSSEAQGLVYALLGALIVTVLILVCVGVAFFCLLQRNCAKMREEKRALADGTLSAPRPRRSIRDSVRYIGVRVKKDETQEEGKAEKEKELTSRPLPIPTESDVEEEEEEEQQRRSHIGSFHGHAPSASTQAPTDAGYATIPSDMRESIIQSAHKTSVDHLREQGYDVLHPTSAHYKSPRSLSPESPNVYNVPRGSSPVGEYELPVSSRSHSPAISQMKHAVRAQSAPHPLTYDVPPSRAAPAEVTGGQFGIPSARNHLYSNVSDMYDVPRNSQLMSASDSSGQVPAAYDVLPPRSSPNANATYDIPKSPAPGSIPAQHQNGFMDSTYDKPSSIPAKAGTPRLIPKIQAPDSTYDMPSSLPAKNENNYDVLPRSPHLSRNSGHAPSSAEDPPKVLTTPKQSRRFNLPSPEASPDMNSAHPTIEGFSSMPRPSQDKEGYYDVPPKRSAVVENGQPVQNVEGYYDTPRHHPVIVTPLTAGEECSTLQNGKSEEEKSIPADASNGEVPSAESTPNSKHEHPYSKVKRFVGSDGKQQKVTVMEDWEAGLQDLEAAGVTSFIVSGSPHIARTLL